MRYEHAMIERALAAVAGSRSRDQVVERARAVVSAGRDHFAREERVLFDMARRSLPQSELEWLRYVWAMRRDSADPDCADHANDCG
jgi:hemerythrin-like domain-containing protein